MFTATAIITFTIHEILATTLINDLLYLCYYLIVFTFFAATAEMKPFLLLERTNP